MQQILDRSMPLGPSLWNSLLQQLQQTDIKFYYSVEDVFLSGDRDHGNLWLVVKCAVYKYAYLLTYLLTWRDWSMQLNQYIIKAN